MIQLSSRYAGIELNNPIVAASSGMTATLSSIRKLASLGVGAIVVKSLFEEQLEEHALSLDGGQDYAFLEAGDYLLEYIKSHETEKHLTLLRDAKRETNIPIIASINCYKEGKWIDFAQQLASTGCDALELNIMRLEVDRFSDEKKLIEEYVAICKKVKKALTIPVAVKIDYHFACLPALVDRLRAAGIDGVTCFNRGYRMDIDIEKESITSGDIFTHTSDLSDTLKFTGILSALIPQMPISASGGVHSSEDIIKAILSGASSVQIASALYQQGADIIPQFLEQIRLWMERKGYKSIDEFRAILNAHSDTYGNMYERVQFMRYFSNRNDLTIL